MRIVFDAREMFRAPHMAMPEPSIDYNVQSRNVQDLESLYHEGRLNLNPGFQRRSVWSPRDRVKLIDSILRKFPLPAIFLYRRDNGGEIVYDVIDGKQRLESIFMFMGVLRGQRFAVRTALPGSSEIEELDWRKLGSLNRHTMVRDYQMTVILVKGELGDMIDVFVRINSTGKALSAQEKRHAKYFQSPFLRAIGKAAEDLVQTLKVHRVLSEAQAARMKHVELFAEIAYSIHCGDVIHKKAALDHVMADPAMTALRIDKAVAGAKASIRQVLRMFPDLRTTRFRQLADFYSLVVLIAKLTREGSILTDRKRNGIAWSLLRQFGASVDSLRVRQKRMERTNDADTDARAYLLTVAEGTDSETNRRNRERILRGLLEPVFARKDAQRVFSEEQRRLIWHSAARRTCANPKCQRQLGWADFTVDHVRAHSKGGRTRLDNAQLMCRSCNAAKGNRKALSRLRL